MHVSCKHLATTCMQNISCMLPCSLYMHVSCNMYGIWIWDTLHATCINMQAT
jgi:hypothetical protein